MTTTMAVAHIYEHILMLVGRAMQHFFFLLDLVIAFMNIVSTSDGTRTTTTIVSSWHGRWAMGQTPRCTGKWLIFQWAQEERRSSIVSSYHIPLHERIRIVLFPLLFVIVCYDFLFVCIVAAATMAAVGPLVLPHTLSSSLACHFLFQYQPFVISVLVTNP